MHAGIAFRDNSIRHYGLIVDLSGRSKLFYHTNNYFDVRKENPDAQKIRKYTIFSLVIHFMK